MVKLGTFSITSYTLSHLFQSLFFIHITLRIFNLCKSLKLHVLTFSHKLKSEKQTIFPVGAIMQKCSCHVNNCLSDLFYLGIQKCLMFEVFTSNAATVRQTNKTRNFWDLYMYIYYTFLLNYKMNILDLIPFFIISYLTKYVSSIKNSLNCFATFGSSASLS